MDNLPERTEAHNKERAGKPKGQNGGPGRNRVAKTYRTKHIERPKALYN